MSRGELLWEVHSIFNLHAVISNVF